MLRRCSLFTGRRARSRVTGPSSISGRRRFATDESSKGGSGSKVSAAKPEKIKAAEAPGSKPKENQGSSSFTWFLVATALIAPPAYVAYKLTYDPDDKDFAKTIQDNAPALYSWLKTSEPSPKPKEVIVSKIEVTKDVVGEDWVSIKAEVEDLARRLEAQKKSDIPAVKKQEVKAPEKPPVQKQEKLVEPKEEPISKVQAAPIPVAVPVEENKAAEEDEDTLRSKIQHMQIKLLQMKDDAEKTTNKKLKDLEKDLRSDLEIVLSKDLASGDIEDLRRRIVQLVLELKDRHRWEALRIHELTKIQTQELINKYDDLLRQQSETYELLLKEESKKIADKEAREANERLTNAIIEAKHTAEAQTQTQLDKQRKSLELEMNSIIQREVGRVQALAANERQDRLRKLEALKLQIEDLKLSLKSRSSDDQFSKKVHEMSLVMFDLIEKVHESKPFVRELRSLRQVAGDDAIVKKVVDSFPERAAISGVAAQLDLERRFNDVYDSCQKLALLPEEGGGMLQYVLANVVQTLSLRESGMAKGEDPESVLKRVKYYVMEEHDLQSAVNEFDKLKEPIKHTASDWLALAKERIAAEQALKVLRAHISTLAINARKSL